MRHGARRSGAAAVAPSGARPRGPIACLGVPAGTSASYFEQLSAGLGEFLHCIDELVAVRFVESDGQREHAALGEPDAARQEIEIEEVAQCGVAAFSVFL